MAGKGDGLTMFLSSGYGIPNNERSEGNPELLFHFLQPEPGFIKALTIKHQTWFTLVSPSSNWQHEYHL
jgi:hypothetical protein